MSLLHHRDKQRAIKFITSFVVAYGLAGGIAIADQLVNGNFSAGYSGFTSGYTLVAANGTVQTGPGEIGLTTNPAISFTNGYNSYTDHTGNPGGLMLFVDGYYPGTSIWSETVPVVPSNTYTFTGWVASAYPANLAILGLFASGSQVGPSFTAPSTGGVWTEWTTTLVTGPSLSSLTLSIQDLNPNVYLAGDDFSLDDLSLSGPSPSNAPEPSTLGLLALAGIGGIAMKWRRGFTSIGGKTNQL